MIDRYTKAVLTAIAAALIVLAAQNGISRSHAEFGQLQKVQICDSLDCAIITKAGGANGLVVVPAR